MERPVLRMGHPELRRVAEPVARSELGTARIASLVEDLWDTMAARGGVGLAATQIGESRRVVVFGLEWSARYPHAPAIPRTVLVNPVIEPLDDEMGRGVGRLPQLAGDAGDGHSSPACPLPWVDTRGRSAQPGTWRAFTPG